MQKAIEFLTEKDPIFKLIIEKYGLPIIPTRPQGFETMVLLILEQQVSIDSAKATFLKMKAKVPHFHPEILLHLSVDEYRNFGVSRQKTSYIKALSLSILNNEIDLESLSNKPSNQVREELIKIKGIGSVYSSRIIKYRSALGGFAYKTQLKEVYGIDDSLFQALLPFIQLDTSFKLRKIQINTVDKSTLSKHPYFRSKRLSDVVIKYRNNHGSFKQGDDLLKIHLISDSLLKKISPYLDFQ